MQNKNNEKLNGRMHMLTSKPLKRDAIAVWSKEKKKKDEKCLLISRNVEVNFIIFLFLFFAASNLDWTWMNCKQFILMCSNSHSTKSFSNCIFFHSLHCLFIQCVNIESTYFCQWKNHLNENGAQNNCV